MTPGQQDARSVVAGQALAIAAAWSPVGAPAGWWLTAETLVAIAEEDVLLDLAAEIPLDRLPPLLLAAAVSFLVRERRPPMVRHYPEPGGSRPPPDPGFRAELVEFARAERDGLAELCATHRYQMNEVGRCADVLPVLAMIAEEDDRPLAVVDLGTGAGLGLHLDRYHYTYRTAGSPDRTVGEPSSPVRLTCEVRSGGDRLPVPSALPVVADRVGVDVEPLDVADPHTFAWLAACVPPEAGAVTRFAAAAAIARADPARAVRGSLLDVLEEVVDSIAPEALVCLVDTYVHVFLPPADLRRFDRLLAGLGHRRDLEWVSVDPLVPLGPDARAGVQGLDVPADWVRDARDGGVFGVIGRVRIRGGRRSGTVLGRAHPGAAWLEWR
ncbi:DUF2332 family protein [Pseudonocardia xinjiangensis]|uniref:DUF2332 family protein n=1 Tax=Pseudonocardia xinjiangensis TaxID=75289 RepID=UPI003D8D0520